MILGVHPIGYGTKTKLGSYMVLGPTVF